MANMVSCSNEFPRVPYTSGGTRESGPRNLKRTTMLLVWEERVGIRAHAAAAEDAEEESSAESKWLPTNFLATNYSDFFFSLFTCARGFRNVVGPGGVVRHNQRGDKETKTSKRLPISAHTYAGNSLQLGNPPPPAPAHLICLPNKFRVRKKCTSRLVSCVPHPLPPFCKVLNLLWHVIWWKFTKRNWNLESSKQERGSLLAEGVWK
jgi:hypothetical protein